VFDVLRVRDYRLVAAGELLSSLGDWLLLVAAPYFVLRLTGSTLATGLSLAAETVPALLLGPVAGVFADRWDRRRTMLAADLLRSATVALMLLVHHPGQVWLIYVALIGEASLGQFFGPARQAFIPALVGRGPQLAAANSLAALISGTVRLVGGPVGGALYALAGFAPVVALDAASYLASALLITAIRYRAESATRQRHKGTALRRFAGDRRAGATHLGTAPGLPAVLAAASVFPLGNAALTALLVPYTGNVLHAGASTLGLLFAALGAGRPGLTHLMRRPRYPSDMTDAEWSLLEPLLPAAGSLITRRARGSRPSRTAGASSRRRGSAAGRCRNHSASAFRTSARRPRLIPADLSPRATAVVLKPSLWWNCAPCSPSVTATMSSRRSS
jgi:MFS family permease